MERNKLLDYLGWTFVTIGILLLSIGGKYIENVIDGIPFLLLYGGISILIASLWIFILSKMTPGYFIDVNETRMSGIASHFAGILIIFLFIFALYNYDTALRNQFEMKAFVLSKSENVKTKTKYTHLLINGEEERFSPNAKEYKLLPVQDTTILTVGRGSLGYQVIIHFVKPIK